MFALHSCWEWWGLLLLIQLWNQVIVLYKSWTQSIVPLCLNNVSILRAQDHSHKCTGFFSPLKKVNRTWLWDLCVQLWCWCIPLSLAAEIHSTRCLNHLHLNTLVLSSFLLFLPVLSLRRFILPATAPGGNGFWAIVCEMFLYLAVLAGSAQKWMSYISSVSTPCPVLISFFHREECDDRREVSEHKNTWCLYRLSTALFSRRVFGLQQPIQELNELELFSFIYVALECVPQI